MRTINELKRFLLTGVSCATACIVIGFQPAQAAIYTDLHDFGGTVTDADGTSGPDGYGPWAGVTFDSAGNMYGTTYQGGAYQDGSDGGMVWEITAAGTYKDLHDFGGTVINAGGTSGPDGYNPSAAVTFDSVGNMYGTTVAGGPHNDGIIWEITKSGTFMDLHDFGGTVTNAGGTSGPDGDNPNGGVTFDVAGNMYGTAEWGGPHNDGVAWEITASGAYKDLHDFGGTVINAGGTSGPDGLAPLSGVTFDSNGNLYGTTRMGGAYSQPNITSGGTVWEITAAGAYKDLHDFQGTVTNADGTSGSDGIFPTAGVTFDSAGNMFGTATGGGVFGATGPYGIVWEISASGVYTDLHNFGATITNANGTSGPDGFGPVGGVTFDSDGNMYGTTFQGGPYGGATDGMIWEIMTSGSYRDLHDFGGTVIDTEGTSTADGIKPISGVTFDNAGNIYGTTQQGGANNGPGIVWKMIVKPTLTSVTVTPGPTLTLVLKPTATQQFTATAYDQYGNPLAVQPAIAWSLAAGSVGSLSTSGLYHSGTVPGTATVTAKTGAFSATVAVTVNPAPVTVATAASATPNPVTGATTKLSVLGGYAGTGGGSALTYTWSSTGPAAVTYSANGTDGAKNTTATFTHAGSYKFTVAIAGPFTSTSSSVTVTVNQTLTSITVTPSAPTLGLQQTQQFTATANDQFGAALSTQPAFVWSLASGSVGSITDTGGLYRSGKVAGTATVRAKSGTVMGTSAVTVD